VNAKALRTTGHAAPVEIGEAIGGWTY